MPVYEYTARDLNGKLVKGEFIGNSLEDTVTGLKAQKIYPLKVSQKKQESEKNVSDRSIFKKKVKKKNVAVFARQFSSMLRSGIPLLVILDVLFKQEKNPEFKQILSGITSDIMKGFTLSSAMEKYKEFPEFMISMVSVGEANGKLDVCMARVATNMEKEIKITGKLKSAMIYPCILLSITVIAIFLLTFLVLPVFSGMFQQSGVKLPALTSALLGMSDFMKIYWYIPLIFAGMLVICISFVRKSESYKMFRDKFIFSIPVIGGVQNIILMTRFCQTLSALIEGGVGIIFSLQIVKNVIGNRYIKEMFDVIIKDVQTGLPISESVSKYKVFTPMVVSSLKIGEESGTMGEVLARTADVYEDESDLMLQKLTSLVQPVITVIMAIGIGILVISIIQPMFQMYSFIGDK